MKHRREILVAAMTAALAWWSIGAIREKTGGALAPPLDDTFIHFQYARAFAEGHPLHYVAGDPASSGATSLLWSLVLAIPWKLGLRDTSLLVAAWAIGFVCLGLLALETQRLASRILPRGMADLAAGLTLIFGGHLWCAASGMEVIPFAWVMMRTARLASECIESASSESAPPATKLWDHLVSGDVELAAEKPRVIELAVFGALAPLLRPEGLLVALLAAGVLFVRARKLCSIPIASVIALPLFWLALTGHASASTTMVKWLPSSPYLGGRALAKTVFLNVEILFGQLFDGKGPARTFIPEGFGVAFLFLLAPVAILFAAEQRAKKFRAFAILVVAFGILLPTTYDTFLANRLRYLWPFTAAWAIGLVAVVDAIAVLASRFDPNLRTLRGVLGAVMVIAIGSKAVESVEDLAVSAGAIHAQQVSLARFAQSLPSTALVGVNDAGAIAYLSGKKTFDVVGLTTTGEARFWSAGAGSRFEHYERLARAGKPLPTHLIVHPGWWEIAPLLGAQLAERTVEGATVLGGPQMIAAEANWALLGSAEAPSTGGRISIVDELDVADLESEGDHGYLLGSAKKSENVLVLSASSKQLDGARMERSRDQFELRLIPGGRLLLRVGTTAPITFVTVTIGGIAPRPLELTDVWQEFSLEVPTNLPDRRHQVVIEAAPGQRFVSLHHWSIAP